MPRLREFINKTMKNFQHVFAPNPFLNFGLGYNMDDLFLDSISFYFLWQRSLGLCLQLI